jgi:hypothetical protein
MEIHLKRYWSQDDYAIFHKRMNEAGLNPHWVRYTLEDKKNLMSAPTIEAMKELDQSIRKEVLSVYRANLAINHSNFSFPKGVKGII